MTVGEEKAVTQVYAFECDRTNLRIGRLSWAPQEDGAGVPLLCDAQRVALIKFTGVHLHAALLLGDEEHARTYGENGYEKATEPGQRPFLRDAFKLCLGYRDAADADDSRRRYIHAEAVRYSHLLLAQVMEQLGREKLGNLRRTLWRVACAAGRLAEMHAYGLWHLYVSFANLDE